MSDIRLAAESTSLILNGTPINDTEVGDFLTLTFPNPLTGRVNGSGNSVNVNKRADGNVLDLVVRVFKYSASDVFLNSACNQAEPVTFSGSVREDYTRDGVASAESYILVDGSITTRPANTKSNTDNNAMMEYTLQFRNASRSI